LSGIGYPDMPALGIGPGMHSLFEDYRTVKEGFQALADALAGQFKKNGGELRLHAPVDKILTRNGAAVGVRCNGEDIFADAVISACDYKKTFLQLLGPDDVPRQLREKIAGAAVSEGFFAVYLGLSISNEKLLEKLQRPVVMCVETRQDVDVRDSGDADYFKKISFAVHAISDKHPGLAPEGKSSVMIETHVPYRWMNDWGGGDRARYDALKTAARDTLISRLDAFVPGIQDAIEFKDAATPHTFERYTGNTDGATSAWSWNPKKKYYKNTLKTHIDTPVRGLYIGSCWATQMGGIPGAIDAAYACVKKIQQ
jgi:phytoene dehydrogenase-like protein